MMGSLWFQKCRVQVWLLVALFMLGTSSGLVSQKAKSDTLEYTVVKVLPNDRCIVSGEPLGPDDICLEVRGRRIPLKRKAFQVFLQDPEKYFAKVQPKAALFTEDLRPSRSLNLGWFLFGLYVLAGLIFAAITAQTAVVKGLPPIPWFFAGLLANVVAFFAILTREAGAAAVDVPKGLRKVPRTAAPVPCPGCGNENHPSAKKCLDCGHPLTPRTESEIDRLDF